MGRLFGTDGARGVANTELTNELAMQIGRAAAMVLTRHCDRKPKILIGKDTRISSDMLEAALTAGFCSVGADVVLCGVVPTPAVAYLVGRSDISAGVMISASHNPCEYNGIKLFNHQGYKLPDALEAEIEAIVLDGAAEIPAPAGGDLGRIIHAPELVETYMAHIASTVDVRLDGLELALDCANGSSSATAKKLFEGLGAACHMLSDAPDGVNINAGCGSTHMENLSAYVREHKLPLGLAFDGDADRCLAVDENGTLIDGDRLIAIFAKELKEKGKLQDDTAVVTVMTNIGFRHYCRENGVKAVTTKVGDRYVLEEMTEKGYSIGGEQSGHIIFKEYATTGDGQLSGVQLAAAMVRSGKKASELAAVMRVFPQTMVNITVSAAGKELLETDPVIIATIDAAANELGKAGRILVRASGTEPLVRVMVEGADQREIQDTAERVAEVIRRRTASCGQ